MNEQELTTLLLKDMLKEVIFDIEKLKELKLNVQETLSGKITPKEYRKYILVYMKSLYERLHDKLDNFIAYNFNHTPSQTLINNYPENTDENSLLDILHEKDKFLEALAQKVLNINAHMDGVLE